MTVWLVKLNGVVDSVWEDGKSASWRVHRLLEIHGKDVNVFSQEIKVQKKEAR